jgi:hypothetical protein
MNEDRTWNDTTRGKLREILRNLVLGEVRLANCDHASIIQICREVYIEDECPADEWGTFVRFATEELEKAATRHSTEQAMWPRETIALEVCKLPP